MSWEEYELMPWKLGWKHEYWDGHAHITPREHAVCVVADVVSRPVGSPCVFRSLLPEDQRSLSALFFQAFRDTVEFCDWKTKAILEAAVSAIETFRSGQRGKPHNASRVAVSAGSCAADDRVIGAALIVEPSPGQPVLDMLFVSTRERRRGIASALVGAAMNELDLLGVKTLESAYVMGNEESRAWHQGFGFVEEPDLITARLYYRHAQHELKRNDALHHLSESEWTQITEECARWKGEAERLDAIAREQGYDKVSPVLRRVDRCRA